MDEKEKFYIKEYNTKAPNGYNLTDGGEGSLGYHPSKETNQKRGYSTKISLNKPEIKNKHLNALRKNREIYKDKYKEAHSKNANKLNRKYIWKIENIKTNEITKTNCLKDWCKQNNLKYITTYVNFVNHNMYKNYKIVRESIGE